MTRVLCAEQITDLNTISPDTLFIVEIGVNTQPKIIFEKGSPNNGQITATTTDAKYYKITAHKNKEPVPVPVTESKVPAPVTESKATTPATAAAAAAASATVSKVLPQATTQSPAPAPAPAPAPVTESKATAAAAAAASATVSNVLPQATTLEPVTDKACGLTNPSSLCYANSAIQLLLDIPEIPEYFNKITDTDINKIDTKYEAEKNNIKLLRTIFNKIKIDSAKKTPTNIINILKDGTEVGAEPSTLNTVYNQLVEPHRDDFLKNENDITTERAELLKATDLTENDKKAIIEDNEKQMSLLKNKYRQADAHEFLLNIFFNNFHANNGLIRLDTPNNFTKKIGVNETTETICKNNTKYDTGAEYTPIITLHPDTTKESISINTLLEKHTEIEIKNDETEGCKTGEAKTGTRRSVQTKDTLQADTKYIILYLNRNVYNNDGQEKNFKKIDITKEITINNVQFRIKGCIFHVGPVGGGHYVYGSYDKDGNPKHVRDDAQIIEKPDGIAPKVFEQDGYESTVCLYERIEDQIQTNKGGSIQTKKRKHKNKKRKTQYKNRN